MNNRNDYIPQIDGLRAIAVLSVILFHADFEIFNFSFEGGYFGVDIFFVISGYLITRLILNEIKKKNSFNFKNFYLRRIRRILPVLLLVAIVSYPFAWLILLPVPFLDYVGSIISGIFFSSNFYFYFTQVQYGVEPSLYQPFLHYWSLSVEEQFYIIYPISLLFIYKYFKRNLSLVFGFIALFSFTLSIALSFYNPSLNFFILPTRIWEFLLGAFAAKLHIENNKFTNNKKHFFFQLFGIILIAISVFYFDENKLLKNADFFHTVLHPGLATLFPVIGTFLIIIFSNKNNLINKLLSFKPIVFIGLISYSLYLWHLPIFVFLRISEIDFSSNYHYILLVILIFILSIFSYYFVEKPFRNKNTTSLKKLFIYCGAIVAILLSLSLHAIKNKGYQSILPDYFNEFGIAEIFKDNHVIKNDTIEKEQLFSDNVLLIGDSHAGDFIKNIKKELSIRNKNLLYIPYLNIFSLDLTDVETNGVKRFLKKEVYEILDKKNISTVILISRLPLYWHKKGFDAEEGADSIEVINNFNYFLDSKNKKLVNEKRTKIISESFNKSILEILEKDINVIIMYPVPEVGYWVPTILAGRILPHVRIEYLLGNHNKDRHLSNIPKYLVTTSYDLYIKRNREVSKMLDQIEHPNLYRVYPHKKLCNKQLINKCITHTEKEVYYRDNNHLSKRGRELIMPDFINIFNKLN